MTARLRVIDTGRKAARWNVAMTAALTELHSAGVIPDTLRFHRYPKSVLVGRHQVLSEAVDVERCRASGVEIARRVTGGGAVYMAPEALAWDIVSGRYAFGAHLDHAAAIICEAVASGLSRLGLPAQYRAPNDIEVDGRKICGSSGYFDGRTLVYQGTILIDTDLLEMRRFLRLPPAQRGLPRRVTSVAEILGRVPDPGEIEGVLTASLSHSLQRALERAEPAAQEMALADRLHSEELGLDAFVDPDMPVTGDEVKGSLSARRQAWRS